ncbi:hypothetical protein Bca4012_089635 [Brassica carinata]
MSIAMDKALMAMSLEEEDEPFNLPDLPEFSSVERNYLSLIGRILNPDCQKMRSLILDMPRKWQKVGKCRGVALSREKFQFIFDNEYDLLDVLDKGVHTYNEWTLVIQRWVENPPEDYLQYIPLWVQIRQLPVNYYTAEAISALGDFVGKVDVVAFDPNKVQLQNFVRNSCRCVGRMRQYLLVSNVDERRVREDRIKKSVAEAEADPIAKKSLLSLEPIPQITNNLDKGKGRVFDYEDICSESSPVILENVVHSPKLMESAIRAGSADDSRMFMESRKFGSAFDRIEDQFNLYQCSSSVKRDSLSIAHSSGTITGNCGSSRRRPTRNKRILIAKKAGKPSGNAEKKQGLDFGVMVANRGAFLIAQSALHPSFAQSYVARGPPLGLYELFDVERTLTSL